jgi:hypothetical protein
MGQPIRVSSRPGIKPEVWVFEINRSLTGMETDRYVAGSVITGHRPPDELARRLFALGGPTAITIYSSVITVVAPAWDWPSLKDRIEDVIVNLYIFYKDGVLAAPATSAAEIEASAEVAAEPAAS